MTDETYNAIASHSSDIPVSGYQLQEAIAAIRGKCGFIPTMTRAATNSGWRLKVHWPQAATGELSLNNPPADQHETQTPNTDIQVT